MFGDFDNAVEQWEIGNTDRDECQDERQGMAIWVDGIGWHYIDDIDTTIVANCHGKWHYTYRWVELLMLHG